ncbi:nitrite reductase small subunit NirD [Methylogaea oryzae]|uniref:tRNA-(Guanine-N1)-methyltransferase n=1 Tax=Methylogaea oryzae TaxID=1295382 RepID=A0A8D4VNM3_9GAMM|nr:nitrite reductase small subunit NirD [Methylogaea oryzae]BBL70382.1 tRNA-(guanine-N1)-methyltransferase [Methylogaea oryzae]
MNNWIEVARLQDIPPLGSRVVRTPGGDVALFRTTDDKVYAVRDHCPHKGGPLSQGIVHGQAVTCPLHNWVIELDSGQARAPDEGTVACFAVEVREGAVWLALA